MYWGMKIDNQEISDRIQSFFKFWIVILFKTLQFKYKIIMIILQVNTANTIATISTNPVDRVMRCITLVSVCQMGIMRCLDLPGHHPISPVC